MALTESARHELFTALVTALGEANAVTLIDQLPPPGREPATTEDLDRLGESLRAHTDRGLADLRAHTDRGLADLRAHTDRGLADLRAHTDGGLASVRVEIADLKVEFADRLSRHTRVTVVAVVTMNAATIAAVAALVGGG